MQFLQKKLNYLKNKCNQIYLNIAKKFYIKV